MIKKNKSESFEEWLSDQKLPSHNDYYLHPDDLEFIWDYQQNKIDELENKLFSENRSHNYHCKESQRKNDVIQAEREKVALLKEGLFLSDEFKSDVLSVCNESDLYFDSLNPLVEWLNDNRQALEKLKELEGGE